MVSQGVGLLMKSHGVECVFGEAVIETPNFVRVGERKLETKNIVIATGGHPISLPGVQLGNGVITGEEVAALETAPKSAVIIGGGVEGVEYAGIFASFGIQVTVIEMFDRLISITDKDASELVAKSLSGLGARVMTGTKVEKVEGKDVYAGGEKISADLVIVAIGKRPNIGEDAKKLGIAFDKRGITVDSHMRTNVPNVYAIGDVAGGGLAHVASEQGIIAAENIASMDSGFEAVYPYCIFSVPEVAAVGDVSGEGAKAGVFPFAALGRATASGERVGFVKAFLKDGVVVGAVIAGPHASDLIGEAALAVKMKLKTEDIARTIHAHPTFTEAFQDAVRAAEGKAIFMPRGK
jgi:dihydrolipoamide dehydrogenase